MEGDKSCAWCSESYWSQKGKPTKRSYVLDGKVYFINVPNGPIEYCSAYCANQAMNYSEGKEIN